MNFIIKLLLAIAFYQVAKLISDTFLSGWIASITLFLILDKGDSKCKK